MRCRNLDPFVPFVKQCKYFDDKSNPEYYANSMGALIKSLEDSGSVRKGVTPDQLIWASPMYHEMVDYKNKSDSLFTSGQGSSCPPTSRRCSRKRISSTTGSTIWTLCVLGLSLGLTSARLIGVRAVLDPIVLTLGTIPVLVTAPFFLIWFGTERAPQVGLLTR